VLLSAIESWLCILIDVACITSYEIVLDTTQELVKATINETAKYNTVSAEP